MKVPGPPKPPAKAQAPAQKPLRKRPSLFRRPPRSAPVLQEPPEPEEAPEAPDDPSGTLSSNTPEGLPEAPGWLLGVEEAPTGDRNAMPDNPAAVMSMGRIIFATVDMAHDKAAKHTGWPGWALDDKEAALWKELASYIATLIPLKDGPLIVIIVAVVALEVAKIGMFADWKQSQQPAPDKPPREEKRKQKATPIRGKREPSTQ